ncbi:glutamate--cysteine ligase regulatory subunit [Sitophilus oryzae]|uniref:GCS light chain n=1 Tax=Sitophilus oryzae TaxID=7048 RepID=A0A6J2Y2H6_SITOR|nr:glutamate--cysteine ligase regulatory subunit [Sitophilus oryzae]XP_030757119.1 glutamate--cysteine ligase regulatory subunit [Sitophilus oryzae]XP_030757120.1 glutamate--cysteine ligase regulatory subunit [Sitophilus oryzae]
MGSNGLIEGKKVIFSTGNIMSISDITKKPSQNSTQELIDAIKFTLKDYEKNSELSEAPNDTRFILRSDDIQAKIQENDLEDLKIGLKVFLTNDSEELLDEALKTALSWQLKVKKVTDVIVSFKKQELEQKADNLEEIKKIWLVLENYVQNGIVDELGVADIEEPTFRALYDWAKIKPNIIQINLATCCVVPPTLQSFCKEKDIKLFTHSDSSDILPDESVKEVFGAPLDLQWAVRFTIHIKCRGVLTTKGYCLCMSPKD